MSMHGQDNEWEYFSSDMCMKSDGTSSGVINELSHERTRPRTAAVLHRHGQTKVILITLKDGLVAHAVITTLCK